MALQLFALARDEMSKRGQGRQPRTVEDRRLTGVPACRNRVAEIGSRNRGSEKRIVGPLRKQRTSFGAWAGATPRGGNLGRRVVARRLVRCFGRSTAQALRVTGRFFLGPTHSNWWGSRGGEIPPVKVSNWDREPAGKLPACATEGRRLGLLRVRHPSRGGGARSLGFFVMSRRSSERTAREIRGSDRGVRGQDRNVFRFLERTGAAAPGRQTPSRSVDPAEASLDVVKRQAPHLVNGESRNARREPRTRVGDWIGSRWQKSVGRNRGTESKNRFGV